MDTRNPFQPPQAHVDDPAPPPMPRPATVDRAFWLLIGSAAIGLASYLAPDLRTSPLAMVFTLGWTVGFACLLRAGKNWARIVFLVFFALGFVVILALMPTLVRLGAVPLVVMCVQTALQGYAMWLVFSAPGSAWFRRFRQMGA